MVAGADSIEDMDLLRHGGMGRLFTGGGAGDLGRAAAQGNVNSAKGAASLVARALVTARNAGATRMVTVRTDSANNNHSVITSARRDGTRFSVNARMDKAVNRAISEIPETASTPIKDPNAIWDNEQQRWISDAEVGRGRIHGVHLHMPSGVFTANAAWLVLATIAYNLTRDPGSDKV